MATPPQPLQRIEGLQALVGNTPLLAIECAFRGRDYTVFAKQETLNLTGSVKDRMALHIVRRAYERGVLKPGMRIIEATSGNTGISFSAVGRALGHPVTIFMPDWMSDERINLIRSFGAEIHMVSPEEGGFLGSIERAEALANSDEMSFLPRQFSNTENVEAHRLTTGPEIWWQLGARGLTPDAFVAGVGTGGTVMGVGDFLRSVRSDVAIHPLEPSNSPTLKTGHKVGSHRIQGISDEFIPPIVDLSSLDEVVDVHDGDAILMAQTLARELGLGVGISAGANFLGALRIAEQRGPDAVVVTLFPDSNKKYLSTDLLRPEPVRPEFISPEVSLGALRSYKRVCHTCYVPLDTGTVRPESGVPKSTPLGVVANRD
ncbi:MAG: PLP-dependent cysteine synthase family protein [Planctomycetota bacterium]|jgi:cysteine synthase A